MGKKMAEIYMLVAGMTKERIEKEKETNLSEETYRMISLTQSLYNSTLMHTDSTAREIF